MRAIIIPRQIDFTGNFFPPESLGTNVFENTSIPLSVWNFTDLTSTSNPISQVVKVLLCTRLQQFLARFYVQNYYTTAQHLAI
ncbi:MAG: hypothetical protein QNJ32_27885 [Xenococcaceae cyanobacterium MO_167.B27]|nr:hypothetical protein [Xenococcaceae cyanobacterium MO_167.B27]